MIARSRCQCLVIKINESTDRPFVRTLRKGRVQLEYRGMKLQWRELPARPVREQSKALPVKPAVVKPLAANHPWRRLEWVWEESIGAA